MRALLMTTFLGSALAIAGTAAAQNAVRPGQTVQGALSAKDPTMPDGSHYRCYVIRTEADQVYTVTMTSSDFDAYLSAGEGGGCEDMSVWNDDGPDMNTDAQLRFRSNGGEWSIRANTLSEGETGDYRLAVSQGERIQPTMEIEPISIGETVQGRLSLSDRLAADGSYYDCYRLTVDRAVQVAIRQDSTDFDAYLALYPGGRCEGESIASDDDSGGGTSALISEQLQAGDYSFRANSLNSAQEGAYSVTVSSQR